MTPSYALGLFFIVCVSLIWSLASIVVQYLYTEQSFDSPFLLTYIGTSLFVLFLPTRLFWEHRRKLCRVGLHGDDDSEITAWNNSGRPLYEHVPLAESSLVAEDTEMIEIQEDGDHEMMEPPDVDGGDFAISGATHEEELFIWSHQEHIQAALRIALIWFIANWSYNASLAYTSITSSTVLASTGSLFTFLFAVLWGDEPFTCFKLSGVLLGVTGSILTGWSDVGSASPPAGIIDDDDLWNSTLSSSLSSSCVGAGHLGTPHNLKPCSSDSGSDRWDERHSALWGDFLGLLSAVGYGAYAVMIRILCPHDERCMSMQLLLGYIGLFNAVVLSPIAIYVLVWPAGIIAPSNNDDDDDTTGTTETAKRLTLVVFGYLVAKGMLDNVLSDYLWARAVVLTSATVATVGLGLTIPLAFVSDWIMGHSNVASTGSILGALSVLMGFAFVNLESNKASSDVVVNSSNSELEVEIDDDRIRQHRSADGRR